MAELDLTEEITGSWGLEPVGPASLARVMEDVEQSALDGDVSRFHTLPTGFEPLDSVLNGGMRPGEMAIIGGPFGVGKTIFGLQVARNVAALNSNAAALYVCFEHDRTHLLSRLLCLEGALQGYGINALTLRRLAELALDTTPDSGLISRLRSMGRYAPLLEQMDQYARRLVLAKASGDYTTLDQIRRWVQETWATGAERVLLVVDYIQKIPLRREATEEAEATTVLAHGLKELALATGTQVLGIAASDRLGLRAKRMRLSDMRGSSALQYEADIGMVLNNKHSIVSREHMVYNLAQADAMRNWVVLSVEKNRAGVSAVDLEFALDAAHFCIDPAGGFVRDRLVDEKTVLD